MFNENDKTVEEQLERLPEVSPSIDQDTLRRSREVEAKLAAVGIKLGGYRLEPALGGARLRPSEQPQEISANRQRLRGVDLAPDPSIDYGPSRDCSEADPWP